MKQKVLSGAIKLYGSPLPTDVKDRLTYEMEIIHNCGMSDSFDSLSQFLQDLRNKGDIMIEPGYGSMAGSVIAYCLNITSIDPLENNLLFESFLCPESTSVPEIHFYTNKNVEIEGYEHKTPVIMEGKTPSIYFHPLKHLAIISNCIQMVKDLSGINIDLKKIPIDDELTFRLIRDADTDGLFRFEEEDARCYLKYLQPRCYNDLLVFSALYQPVLMDYIPEFIDRTRSNKTIKYDMPIMEKYLKDSVGLLAFQEQLVLLSRLLAGFSRKESFELLHSFQNDQQGKLLDSFIEGGERHGHQTDALAEIWNSWNRIGKYLQSKSHITCQTWITYRTAYLKAHYPDEFKLCKRMTDNQ